MMQDRGLNKLIEECAELIQICAKKVAFPDEEIHPDKKPIKPRLEEEIADVLAAIDFVTTELDLDFERIKERKDQKFALFCEWNKQEMEY